MPLRGLWLLTGGEKRKGGQVGRISAEKETHLSFDEIPGTV